MISLTGGLALFGFSLALLVRAELGLDPWDVLHQGLAETLGARIGVVVVATSFVALAAWVPLRQRPGVGTIGNAAVVGVVFEIAIEAIPDLRTMPARVAVLAAGIVLNAVATGLYVGAGLGPGPRDGIMTGLAARGWPIRRVRTSIEGCVLALGWLLGGTIGVGTAAYAISIGPLIHIFLPIFTIDQPADRSPTTEVQRCAPVPTS